MNNIIISEIVNEIHTDGICIVPKMINVNILKKIKNRFDNLFNTGKHLGPSVNIAGLKKDHLMMYGKQREEIEKEYKNFYLTDFDFNKGTKHYRHLTNGRSINQPLVHIEDLWKIVFLDSFREISSEYFNDKSKLGFVKVRKFFSNNLPLYDTNYFHYDDNSKELLKAIIFLNDTNEDKGGSFVYVQRSHIDLMGKKSVGSKYARTDNEINTYYGENKILNIYPKTGDVIFVNTLGFHKGVKPISSDRNVCFINFVLEEEYGGSGMKLQLDNKYFSYLSPDAKNFGEYIDIING